MVKAAEVSVLLFGRKIPIHYTGQLMELDMCLSHSLNNLIGKNIIFIFYMEIQMNLP